MPNCSRLHEQKDDLAAKLAAWKKSADAITKRWPAWERLLDFHNFAAGLPEADACANSIAAITSGRTLLADPDPVPDLTKQLTTALRIALGKLQDDLAAAFQAGDAKLAASLVWGGRTDEQRATIAAACQLTPPPKAAIGTDDEILAALRARTLADRRNLLDAVPQRFARALEEAAKLATPEAVRVALPGAIINNTDELDQWLAGVREQVEDKTQRRPGDSMSSLPTLAAPPVGKRGQASAQRSPRTARAKRSKLWPCMSPILTGTWTRRSATCGASSAPRPGNWAMARASTKRGAYEIKHLVEKLAYDQWHRLLFARFLLENNLLISPEHGVSVSLDDCEELAPSLGLKDAWAVAARFAADELPGDFPRRRPGGRGGTARRGPQAAH